MIKKNNLKVEIKDNTLERLGPAAMKVVIEMMLASKVIPNKI